MFAPPVAKKAQTASSDIWTRQRATPFGQRHGDVEPAPMFGPLPQVGATLNAYGNPEQDARTASMSAKGGSPSRAWNFCSVPAYLPGREKPFQEPPGLAPRLPIQAKLKVGAVDDPLEHEADRVADQVMRMPAPGVAPTSAPPQLSRKCAECEEEKRLQTKPAGPQPATVEAPANVHEVLRSPGQPLDAATRAYFEPRFGRDFSGVRVHTSSSAEQSARGVNAHAYTVGHNMVFGAGQFAPGTREGHRLLAHELTHVVQQSGADGIYAGQGNEKRGLSPIARGHTVAIDDGGQPSVQRKPESKESGPDRARNHKNVRMDFDGRDLIVYADENEIFRWSAQSGRPVPLDPKDVADCGADPVTESYMNNPRFVGIENFGPTPENKYQLSAAGIHRFSSEQEHTLRWKSHEFILQTPFGPIPGGDWGNGLVELRPVDRPEKGPCGNASERKDFFLHGGVLAGSSGCIDIGDSHFSELAEWLQGYPRLITLTVNYKKHPSPPPVGTFTGISGMLAYGHERFSHQPRLAFGKETTATGESRSVASGTYDIIMQWAGGALAAGLRLDVSLSGKDTFVRGGLSSETNFRLFRALYGRLSVGYLPPLSGRGAIGGLEVGGGLEYDFGRVQLEAIYDLIAPMSNDNRTQQVLFGIGIRR